MTRPHKNPARTATKKATNPEAEDLLDFLAVATAVSPDAVNNADFVRAAKEQQQEREREVDAVVAEIEAQRQQEMAHERQHWSDLLEQLFSASIPAAERRAIAEEMTEEELHNALVAADKRAARHKEALALLEGVMGQRHPTSIIKGDRIMFVFGDATPTASRRNQTIERLLKAVRLHRASGLESVIGDLSRQFPHAEAAVRALAAADREAAAWGGDTAPKPILLVGDPGCGKSTLARRYSEMLGFPTVELGMGGMGDTHALTGTRRTWAESAPSAMLDAMARHECGNPCFVLNEVDKIPATGGRWGNVQGTLLSLLEPGDAARAVDAYAEVPCDLSRIRWILTANDLDAVPAPLKSRCTVIRVASPTVEHLSALARVLIEDIAHSRGLDPAWFPALDGEELRALTEVMSSRKRMNLKTGKQEIQAIDLRKLRPLVERILDLRVQTSWGRA